MRAAGCLLGSASLLSLLSPAGALAADIGPVSLQPTWEGFYAGVHGGFVDSRTTIRDEDGTVFDADGGRVETNDLTGLLGVHAGFNLQSGSLVYGLEADYSFTEAGREREFDGTDHDLSSDISGFGSLRARAGLGVDNALFYVTGGAGLVHGETSGSDSPNQVAGAEDFAAIVMGAGVEHKFRSDVSVRLEYLNYYFLEEEDVCEQCTDPAYVGGALHALRFGVGYHFGQGHDVLERDGDNAWGGFYGGFHVGANDTRTWVQDEDDNTLDMEGVPVYTNGLDLAAGVQAGFNWQLGAAVIGIEADYSWTDSGYSRDYGWGGGQKLNSSIDGYGSVRVRSGVTAGNAMAYVTGGLGLVNASIEADNNFSDNRNVSYDWFTALVMGAGAELKLGAHLALRGEYLYFAFDEQEENCPTCSQPINADGEIHAVRLGLNYYLNGNTAMATGTDTPVWAGFYAGLTAGGLQSTTGIRDENGTIYDDEGLTSFTTDTSIAGGVHAGFNWQRENAVLGLEADYTFTDSGDSRIFDGIDHFTSSEISGFGSLRARAGVSAGDTLVFVTGGIGWVNAEVSGYDFVPSQVVNYDNFAALVGGVGAEHRIHEHLSLRAEYLYYGFDEKSDLCDDCGDEPAFADGELHYLRAGLSLHY